MPIFAGLAGASLIGGLIGDATSAYGQSSANDTNMQINQNNINAAMDRQNAQNSFNSMEATIARNFSAQQVQNQENFQTSQVDNAENYNTQMSDTAMQRRVTDLKNAGINPLLAVSQGGASTPTISPMAGSVANAAQASGGPAGQGSGIPSGNVGAAFGNLGGQVNSAIQVQQAQANVDLLKAQTNKVNEEAGAEIPAQVDYLKSMTGLNDSNAKQVDTNVQFLQDTLNWREKSSFAESETAGYQTKLAEIQARIQGQNLDVIKGTRDALISAANSDAIAKRLGLEGARNAAQINGSTFGLTIDILNKALQPVGTAAGAARSLAQ